MLARILGMCAWTLEWQSKICKVTLLKLEDVRQTMARTRA
jgi:hypothetical protein